MLTTVLPGARAEASAALHSRIQRFCLPCRGAVSGYVEYLSTTVNNVDWHPFEARQKNLNVLPKIDTSSQNIGTSIPKPPPSYDM